LLKPDAKEADVRQLCEEAGQHHFASVCIPPCYVRFAPKELRGTDVMVATVVSFPFGYETTAVKAAAVRDAIPGGATELDVVMNISRFLSGESSCVAEELAILNQEATAAASKQGLDHVGVKVIIETAYLTDEMKRLAVRIVAESGADFMKTSTGFAPGGATVEDVALLREEAPEGLAVKSRAASVPAKTPSPCSTPGLRGSGRAAWRLSGRPGTAVYGRWRIVLCSIHRGEADRILMPQRLAQVEGIKPAQFVT
jgi:deoxyribose-phosphate aldolase